MHYTGMLALELPGPDHVVAGFRGWLRSRLAACSALLAFIVASRHDNLWHSLAAPIFSQLRSFLCILRRWVVWSVFPIRHAYVDAISLSPISLSLVVAAVAGIILGLCLVAALTDRRSKDKLRQQKVLLDAALENMSQGLCMFDADGARSLFNERYMQMMGSSAASLKGQCLLDLFRQRKAAGEFAGDPEEFFAQVMADVRAGKSSTKIVQTGDGTRAARDGTTHARRRLGCYLRGHYRVAKCSSANFPYGAPRCIDQPPQPDIIPRTA